MSNIKRYAFQIVSLMVLCPLAMAGVRTTVSEISTAAPELPKLNVAAQQVHALELVPERKLASEPLDPNAHDLRKEVLKAVRASMPKKFKHRAFEIARAVITEANHHQMDPFFLLAVIKTESHFNLNARGFDGEIGLMQILPDTAKWMAAQSGLNPDTLNLEDPSTNIRIGATYFASLRKEFAGYSARYIGAYNMGSGNVRKLMGTNIDPVIYPTKVLNNYRNFYKAAVKTAHAEAAPVAKAVRNRAPAGTKAGANAGSGVRAPKKLQTRAVVNKCGTHRCQGVKSQPAMPNWTTT